MASTQAKEGMESETLLAGAQRYALVLRTWETIIDAPIIQARRAMLIDASSIDYYGEGFREIELN